MIHPMVGFATLHLPYIWTRPTCCNGGVLLAIFDKFSEEGYYAPTTPLRLDV